MKEKLGAIWKRWKERYALFYLYSKVWKYSEGNRRNVVLYWVLFIFANIATLTAPPYLMAKIVGIVQKEGSTDGNINYLFLLLFLTIIADTLFWCLHGPARVIEFRNAFKAEANYKEFLSKGVLGLPLDWHSDHHSGDSIDKIQKGSEALYNFAASSFGPILTGVRLVGCCVLITYFSPLSGIVIVALIAATVFITMRFDKVVMKNYKTLNLLENQITASVFDAVSNITTVIILRVEKRVYDAISHKLWEPYKLFVQTKKVSEVKWFLVSMCCSVMSALVLGIYFLTSKGVAPSIMVVTFFLLMRYTNEIADLFYRFTDMYSDILRQKSRVQNSEILTQDFKEENLTNHILPPDWKEIEIKNLSFSYVSDECGRLHLDNLSLSIKRGETIAVIGKSGSGKTTLLKVIRDLHHPDELELFVDRLRIIEGFGGISRAIALAPQEPEIFTRTIRENITLGAEYTSEEVQQVIELACFDQDVQQLPKGLESAINEKGVNLSGGQKQRLALARALLASQGKSVILLDEPTSSVDSPTELKIYKNILSKFKGTSIISSMHRLHLLPLFDRICMFKNGKIVRSGSFKELLETSPEFQELWKNYNSAVGQ